MASERMQKSLKFIEGELTNLILAKNTEFSDCCLIESKASTSPQLDGFMTAIFKLNITVKSHKSHEKISCDLIVKLMKGSEDFRTRTKYLTQFRNEVYIYGKVIPAFAAFMKDKNSSIECEKWAPKVYYYFYGKVPAVSNIPESVLVLENVSSLGFRSPISYFEVDLDHLFFMMKTIGEYHALSYAMKTSDEDQFKKLVDGIFPLCYQDSNNEDNAYDVLHKIGLARLFEYLDRRSDVYVGRVKDELESLRRKYLNCPTKMLDLLRADDYPYSVIQHGDYNRNNVLFKYDDGGSKKPIDMRMIDFQEVRYGSPAFDLSFVLFMNASSATRDQHWEKLLHFYHNTLFKSLMEILDCDEDDERLEVYKYESFYKHFSRFAIYGVFIVAHFLPWMDCSLKECELLAHHFKTNMKSQEFRDISMSAGGDATNEKIFDVVKHASKMGYLKVLLDEEEAG